MYAQVPQDQWYCCQSTQNPSLQWKSCNRCEDLQNPCGELSVFRDHQYDPLVENACNQVPQCTYLYNRCYNKRDAPPTARTVPCPNRRLQAFCEPQGTRDPYIRYADQASLYDEPSRSFLLEQDPYGQFAVEPFSNFFK